MIEGMRSMMSSEKIRTERNYGLDALRIAAVFYVVLNNFIVPGGLYHSLLPGTFPFRVVSFLRIWTFCAADIFILISGYAGYRDKEEKTDYSKIICLWLQVVFYSVILSFVYILIQPERMDRADILDMVFPLTGGLYWFFSGYTGLLLLKPLLDTAIRNTEKERLKIIMSVLFVMFSVYSLIADPFTLEGGYTFVWMIILYLFGAAMKKCGFGENMAWWKAALGIFSGAFLTWAWSNFGPEFVFVNRRYTGDMFLSFTSPTILGMGVFHVLLFSGFRFPEKIRNIIAFLAPGTFAVYLLISHRCVQAYSLENYFEKWAERPLWAIPKMLLLSAFFVFAGMIIDSLRRCLFRRFRVTRSVYDLVYGPRRLDALFRLASPLYIIAFILIWSLMFWKCQYGYCNIDESLYLSLPYRFYKWGDGLFIHEWDVLQVTSVLMLPLMKVYFTLIPDTVRVFLNFRLIYTIFWGFAAVFFYYRLRKFSNTGAILASLLFLMYASFDIPALSYNSLGVLLLANACIIFLTDSAVSRNIRCFISGSFLACAILCCPYLLILYIVFSITVLILRRRNTDLIKKWLFVSMGAFLILVLFLVFVLSRVDIQTIIHNLPIILDDPEHPDNSFFHKTGQYFIEIVRSSGSAPFVIAGSVLAIAVSMVWKKAKDLCFIAVCILTGIWLIDFVKEYRDINCIMAPICLLGLFCMLHIRDKKIRSIFFLLWIPGIIYSYCQNYSSNQGFYAITNAMTVSAIASVFFIVFFVRESFTLKSSGWEGKLLFSAAALFFAVYLGGELFLRCSCIAFEKGIDDQTVRAQAGTQKGILMTPSNQEYYDSLLEETAPMREDPEIRKVLFLANNPCLYLDTNKEYGAYSSWAGWVSDWTIDRLDLYYEMNPEKIPDAIYIPEKNAAFIPHFEEMGFSMIRTEMGNYILKIQK